MQLLELSRKMTQIVLANVIRLLRLFTLVTIHQTVVTLSPNIITTLNYNIRSSWRDLTTTWCPAINRIFSCWLKYNERQKVRPFCYNINYNIDNNKGHTQLAVIYHQEQEILFLCCRLNINNYWWGLYTSSQCCRQHPHYQTPRASKPDCDYHRQNNRCVCIATKYILYEYIWRVRWSYNHNILIDQLIDLLPSDWLIDWLRWMG